MTTLSQLIAEFDATQTFSVPDTWKQGRTAYGGLTAALAVAAAQQAGDGNLPPLRAAQFSFSAPVTEPLQHRANMLRQGRTATSYAVTSACGDDVAAQSNLIFAKNRPSDIEHSLLTRPEVPGPDQGFSLDDAPVERPAFAANFEMRLAGTTLPMSQAEVPEFTAWVRHRDALGVDPYVALAAIGDALPPAAMTAFTKPAPISSMNWTLNICADEIADATGWFLLRSTSVAAAGGYSYQTMDVWDADGALVMTGSQTVAIFA